jgi:hypothetical protein
MIPIIVLAAARERGGVNESNTIQYDNMLNALEYHSQTLLHKVHYGAWGKLGLMGERKMEIAMKFFL